MRRSGTGESLAAVLMNSNMRVSARRCCGVVALSMYKVPYKRPGLAIDKVATQSQIQTVQIDTPVVPFPDVGEVGGVTYAGSGEAVLVAGTRISGTLALPDRSTLQTEILDGRITPLILAQAAVPSRLKSRERRYPDKSVS